MKIKIDNGKKYIILTEMNEFHSFIIIPFNKLICIKTIDKTYNLTFIKCLEENKDIFEYDYDYYIQNINLDINKFTYIEYESLIIDNVRRNKLVGNRMHLRNGKFHNTEDYSYVDYAYYYFLNGILYEKKDWLKKRIIYKRKDKIKKLL
jgi:hypothetical protein